MQVTPVIPFNGVESGNSSQTYDGELEENAADQIENERLVKSLKADERYQSYKDILFSKPSGGIPGFVVMYGLSGIILSMLFVSMIVLIPVHNILEQPYYWYEAMILGPFTFALTFTAITILDCSSLINIDYIRTLKHFLTFYFWTVLIGITLRTSIWFIWTTILSYRHPMPFHTPVSGYITMFLSQILLWLQFPRQWRRDKGLQRRFGFYLLSFLTSLLIPIVYVIYTKMFISAPKTYQWILGLLLPLTREFNVLIQTKASYKAAGTKDMSVSIVCWHKVNVTHCFFISYMLGAYATDLTCWVILVVDFLMNIFLCLKIIWIRKRKYNNAKKENDMIESLIALIINEQVEIIVPLTYFICFMGAYYGPNAELIGNISSSYFHYIPISNIGLFIKNVSLFVFVDFMSVIISGLMLWIFCKINIVRAYMHIQKEFWLVMAVHTAYTMIIVSSNQSSVVILVKYIFKRGWEP